MTKKDTKHCRICHKGNKHGSNRQKKKIGKRTKKKTAFCSSLRQVPKRKEKNAVTEIRCLRKPHKARRQEEEEEVQVADMEKEEVYQWGLGDLL